MVRILLPVLASLALIACGDGADTTAMNGASAAGQSTTGPAGADHASSDLAGPQALLASNGADLANGQRQFRRCQSCHTLGEGGRHTVGPNLFGVIDRTAADASGFSYSRALSQSGLTWDHDTLDAWIENPRELVPGNRMSFVGLRNADDRRDVIAYIASQTTRDD